MIMNHWMLNKQKQINITKLINRWFMSQARKDQN